MKRIALLLLPVGPFCVALLRYLLPYHTTDNSADLVRAGSAHPGREGAVLWLGLIALITLVPGVITAASLLPPTRLKSWALILCVPGYLCMGALLAQDHLLWSGVHSGIGSAELARIVEAAHPSTAVATTIFVVGHVVGTVLLGVAFLRSATIPTAASWAIIVSQPVHFVAAVILASPTLDLIGWSLTGAGLFFAARALLGSSAAREREPVTA